MRHPNPEYVQPLGPQLQTEYRDAKVAIANIILEEDDQSGEMWHEKRARAIAFGQMTWQLALAIFDRRHDHAVVDAELKKLGLDRTLRPKKAHSCAA